MDFETPEKSRHYHTTQEILIQIAAILTVIPLAPFLTRFIPPIMVGNMNIDLFIAVLVSIVFTRLLVWLLRPMVLPAFILIVLVLVVNQFIGNYSFTNVIRDYKSIVQHNWTVREEKQTDLVSLNPGQFLSTDRTTRNVLKKIQTTDSTVRNFSVQHSLDFFDSYINKYEMLTRYLSLFKYLNKNFKYVPDSQRDEYFASAKETILNGLGGDCDDHSILMASCLMSIGAKCRIIIIEGHMYPELYVGKKDDYEVFQQAVIQLFNNFRIDKLYYHEHNGEYWVNLDYTAHHPGGPYLNNNVISIIDL
ncbi:MAG: transglutaminase protein [Chitinophagaceae bacterium]|nr:transglutaminase protein [Chitinophagaceae bacterium]